MTDVGVDGNLRMEFDDMFAHYGKVEHACLLSMLDPQGRRR
jgi:hypothetical protein